MSNPQRLNEKRANRHLRLRIDGSCIVSEADRPLRMVEELEAVVSANLQRAARLRQSILQKAFKGEITDGARYRVRL